MGLDNSPKVKSWKNYPISWEHCGSMCTKEVRGDHGNSLHFLRVVPFCNYHPTLFHAWRLSKQLWQKPCTVGRGKPYSLKYRPLKMGSLHSMSFITWKELSWVTVMNQRPFIISLWLLVIEKGSCKKRHLQKKHGLSHFYFFVSADSQQQIQKAACKPPQNKHLLEHLSHVVK